MMKNSAHSSTKLIKSSDYQTLVSKQQESEALSVEAQEIIQTSKKIEKEAFESGYADGKKQAKQEMVKKTFAFDADLQAIFKNVEDEICDLVLLTVRKIIYDYDQTKLIQLLVKQSIDLINERHSVTILGHSKTLTKIKKMENAAFSKRITFEDTDQLSENEINLVSDTGSIRLDINDMMKAIEKAFEKK